MSPFIFMLNLDLSVLLVCHLKH